jgi:MFS family permease
LAAREGERAALNQPWYRALTRYEWIVLAAASLGWFFDTMDQRLFILVRSPALAALMPGTAAAAQSTVATHATALFIAGWATGGLIFGVYGDKLGRLRAMTATILTYSVFTGLSAFATGPVDFGIFRFLAGLGIGGEFAAGVALVAEVLPERARSQALGLMQAVAMLGTFTGTALSLLIEPQARYAGIDGWRWLFGIGMLPALLVVVLRRNVRESEAWVESQAASRREGRSLGGVGELFRDPRWRRASVVGMLLGFAGQIGIWGMGTWTPELIRGALASDLALSAADRNRVVGTGLLLKDVASMLGIYVFSVVAARFGRRPAFAGAFVLSLGAAVLTFGFLHSVQDVYWMMPLLGATAWSLLGGYAIYFPELYPTRLRSSGTGLCYNVARYLTAGGLLGMGALLGAFQAMGYQEPLRPAAISVALLYLIGLAVLPFAPETRGRALPQG